jgi:hypothetical protein
VNLAAVAARRGSEFADVSVWAWGVLVALIAVLLVGDLLLVHRTPHEIGVRAAARLPVPTTTSDQEVRT